MQNRNVTILSLGMLLQKVDNGPFIAKVLGQAKKENPDFDFTPELQKQAFSLVAQFNQGSIDQLIFPYLIFSSLGIKGMSENEFWGLWNQSIEVGEIAKKIEFLEMMAKEYNEDIIIISETNPVHLQKIADECEKQNIILDFTKKPIKLRSFPLHVSYQNNKNRVALEKQVIVETQSNQDVFAGIKLIVGDPKNIKNENHKKVIQHEFANTKTWCEENDVAIYLHQNSLENTIKFAFSCQKIESDKNYQPNFSSKRLMGLVRNEDGSSKYFPVRSASAIKNSRINTVNELSESLAKVYEVNIALKGYPFVGDDIKTWFIDSYAILVKHAEEWSVHATEQARLNNFNLPLLHQKVEYFLNNSSLTFEDKEKQIEVLQKNAQVLIGESVSTISLFSRLPKEIIQKIAKEVARQTRDKELISEKESEKIINKVFKL